MPSKLTFFYHDNLGGFSESWIDNSSGPSGVAPVKIKNYLIARMGMSGGQTTWDYVRVSDMTPGNVRLVKVYRPTDPSLGGTPKTGTFGLNAGHVALDADFAGTRLMIRKIAANLSYARVFFAGFPDDIVKAGGTYVTNANWDLAFSLWALAVKNNGWGWNSRTVPVVGSPTRITAMVPQADNTVLITATNPIFGGFLGLDRIIVRVSGQLIPGNLNKSFTAVVVNANQVQTLKPVSILPFVAGAGKIAVKTTVFSAVDSLAIEYVAKRGPGRPFGLYRGRQKVRPQA